MSNSAEAKADRHEREREEQHDPQQPGQVEIDLEAVIAAAARTAVGHAHPQLSDQEVQEILQEARAMPMYQLMLAALRVEEAAAVLVREVISRAAGADHADHAAGASVR